MDTGTSPGKSPGKPGAIPRKPGATPTKPAAVVSAEDTRGTASPASASASGKPASSFPSARKRVPGGEGGIEKLLSQLKESVEAAGGKLADGWTITVKERFGGASAGSSDAFYHSPDGKKFRSKLEVLRFLGLAEEKENKKATPKAKKPETPEARAKREARRKQGLKEARENLAALKEKPLKEWALDDNVTLIGLGEFQEASAMGDPAQGWCDTFHLYPPGYTTLWVHPKTHVKYLCQIAVKSNLKLEFKVTVSSQNGAGKLEYKDSTIKDVWARVLCEGKHVKMRETKPNAGGDGETAPVEKVEDPILGNKFGLDDLIVVKALEGLSRVIHLENYQTVGERSGSWEDEKHMRQKLKASSKTEEIQKARQLLRSQASAQRELKAKQREVLAAQQGKSKEEVQVMKVMNGMIDKLEKSADEQEHMADLAARKAEQKAEAAARVRKEREAKRAAAARGPLLTEDSHLDAAAAPPPPPTAWLRWPEAENESQEPDVQPTPGTREVQKALNVGDLLHVCEFMERFGDVLKSKDEPPEWRQLAAWLTDIESPTALPSLRALHMPFLSTLMKHWTDGAKDAAKLRGVDVKELNPKFLLGTGDGEWVEGARRVLLAAAATSAADALPPPYVPFVRTGPGRPEANPVGMSTDETAVFCLSAGVPPSDVPWTPLAMQHDAKALATVERALMKHMPKPSAGVREQAGEAEAVVAQLREIVRRYASVGEGPVWSAAAESVAQLAGAGRALDLRTLDTWLEHGVFGSAANVAPGLAADLREMVKVVKQAALACKMPASSTHELKVWQEIADLLDEEEGLEKALTMVRDLAPDEEREAPSPPKQAEGSKLTPPPRKRGRPSKAELAARQAEAAAAAAAAATNDAVMEDADSAEDTAAEDGLIKAPWDDGCCVCGGNNGTLVLCDKCDAEYHISCLRPRVREVPKGEWFCPMCVAADAAPMDSLAEARQADGGDVVRRLLELAATLGAEEYTALAPSARLDVLKALCDCTLDLPCMRDELDAAVDVVAVLSKRKRTLQIDLKDYARYKQVTTSAITRFKNATAAAAANAAANANAAAAGVEVAAAKKIQELPVLKTVEQMKQELEEVEEELAEKAVRVEPLGTDRHHNCYWALSLGEQAGDDSLYAVHVERSAWPKLCEPLTVQVEEPAAANSPVLKVSTSSSSTAQDPAVATKLAVAGALYDAAKAATAPVPTMVTLPAGVPVPAGALHPDLMQELSRGGGSGEWGEVSDPTSVRALCSYLNSKGAREYPLLQSLKRLHGWAGVVLAGTDKTGPSPMKEEKKRKRAPLEQEEEDEEEEEEEEPETAAEVVESCREQLMGMEKKLSASAAALHPFRGSAVRRAAWRQMCGEADVNAPQQLAVAALALEMMVSTQFLKPGWRHWRAPSAVLKNTRTAAALALQVRSLDKSVDWKEIKRAEAAEERKRRVAAAEEEGSTAVAAAAAGAAAAEATSSKPVAKRSLHEESGERSAPKKLKVLQRGVEAEAAYTTAGNGLSPYEELLDLCRAVEKAAQNAEDTAPGGRAESKVLSLLEQTENLVASAAVLKRVQAVRMFRPLKNHSCPKVREAVEEILAQWKDTLNC